MKQRTPAESLGVLFALVVFVFIVTLAARLGWALAGRLLGIGP